MDSTEIVLFESNDGAVSIPVKIDSSKQEVWLNRNQLAALYGRDVKTIGKHIGNAFQEELAGNRNRTVAKIATVQNEGSRTVSRNVEYYNLDVIISVGYRVKSQRGVEFRRWATNVLRRYIIDGHTENERRLQQLNQITHIIDRLPENLESLQILDIVKSYTRALDLLDDYDHQSIARPKGSSASTILSYDECRRVIGNMRFMQESDLFGVEKDDSFKGCIGNIYQTFDGEDVYPTLEEKAANLLYFLVKDHPFLDGNKRIAATLFLYFLDANRVLFREDRR